MTDQPCIQTRRAMVITHLGVTNEFILHGVKASGLITGCDTLRSTPNTIVVFPADGISEEEILQRFEEEMHRIKQ